MRMRRKKTNLLVDFLSSLVERKFFLLFLLIIFYFSNNNNYLVASKKLIAADTNQFLVEEDLLLVRDEPKKKRPRREIIEETTTEELGSGSFEISTFPTFIYSNLTSSFKPETTTSLFTDETNTFYYNLTSPTTIYENLTSSSSSTIFLNQTTYLELETQNFTSTLPTTSFFTVEITSGISELTSESTNSGTTLITESDFTSTETNFMNATSIASSTEITTSINTQQTSENTLVAISDSTSTESSTILNTHTSTMSQESSTFYNENTSELPTSLSTESTLLTGNYSSSTILTSDTSITTSEVTNILINETSTFSSSIQLTSEFQSTTFSTTADTSLKTSEETSSSISAEISTGFSTESNLTQSSTLFSTEPTKGLTSITEANLTSTLLNTDTSSFSNEITSTIEISTSLSTLISENYLSSTQLSTLFNNETYPATSEQTSTLLTDLTTGLNTTESTYETDSSTTYLLQNTSLEETSTLNTQVTTIHTTEYTTQSTQMTDNDFSSTESSTYSLTNTSSGINEETSTSSIPDTFYVTEVSTNSNTNSTQQSTEFTLASEVTSTLLSDLTTSSSYSTPISTTQTFQTSVNMSDSTTSGYICSEGFSYNPTLGACSDINECLSNPCQQLNSKCMNTLGSYYCELSTSTTSFDQSTAFTNEPISSTLFTQEFFSSTPSSTQNFTQTSLILSTSNQTFTSETSLPVTQSSIETSNFSTSTLILTSEPSTTLVESTSVSSNSTVTQVFELSTQPANSSSLTSSIFFISTTSPISEANSTTQFTLSTQTTLITQETTSQFFSSASQIASTSSINTSGQSLISTNQISSEQTSTTTFSFIPSSETTTATTTTTITSAKLTSPTGLSRLVEDSTSFSTQSDSSANPTSVTSSSTSISATSTIPISTTTSTTTTTTTATTTSTIATSTITTIIMSTVQPTILVQGANDVSLKSLWTRMSQYNSFPIALSDTDVPFYLFDNSFTRVNIHPNGFITFGSSGNLEIASPSGSVTSSNVPFIAPFWFASSFDSSSDIVYGKYDAGTMDSNVLSSVNSLLNNRLDRKVQARQLLSIPRGTISPEIIHVFTWKNLKFSRSSTMSATFQLILVTSVTQQKTYAIFNYFNSSIILPIYDRVVFIGYSDGNRKSNLINGYSNLVDSRALPHLVFTALSNTNKAGLYIYDLGFATTDPCLFWYNSKKASNFNPANSKNTVVECPTTRIGAQSHPLFREYNGPRWQTNVACYSLKTENIVRNKQFCCYPNVSPFASAITKDQNAGFMYDSGSLSAIIDAGLSCCSENDWSKCSKFYEIYPFTKISNKQRVVLATGGGDPHLTSYDGLTYTFNGYGKFLVSRSNDKSFEIQGRTLVVQNLNDSTISGTLFGSFALRTNESTVLEVRLNDTDQTFPHIDLFVNKSSTPVNSFFQEQDDTMEFACLNTDSLCATAINDQDGFSVVFSNTISVKFEIETVQIDAVRSTSWLTVLVFLPNQDNYVNNMIGLMGNNNADPSDDIQSRSGQRPINSSIERDIYNIAITWRLLSSEEDLFSPFTQSSRAINENTYTPTFLEDVINKASPDMIATCNNDRSCIVDSLLTGSSKIGALTKQSIQTSQRASSSLAIATPSVNFRASTLAINWKNTNTPILIIADIYSVDPNLQVSFSFSNAKNYTIANPNIGQTNRTVTITYYPTLNEYPIFQITATDSQNVTITKTQSGILICNCNSVDQGAQCLSAVQLTPNPYNQVLSCSCSQYFSGPYCQNLIDYCALGNWCDLFPSFKNNMSCQSLNFTEQQRLNTSYVCAGSCVSGFEKTPVVGVCQDINECLNSTACPSNANCTNSIGSFSCACPSGYIYKNNLCQQIDYCATSSNNCDSICNSTNTGVRCSCFSGYTLNADAFTCTKSAVIAGCDALNCSQICTTANNQPTCLCRNGFKLNSNDNKTCDDINECLNNAAGCYSADYCNNTIGSFKCSCPIGTKLDVDFKTCITCPYGTYGLNCQQSCKCIHASTCDNVSGCKCSVGYTGTFCDVEIDYCANYTKGSYSNSVCVTMPGYARFDCLAGYEKRNVSDINCFPIDFCARQPCPLNSACANVIPSYNCTCNSGYYYNTVFRECSDVNECAKNPCAANSGCVNTVGSYYCKCSSGFQNSSKTTDNKNPVCENIDECKLYSAICPKNQTCTDTVGAYTCDCSNGFSVSSSGDCVNSNVTTLAPGNQQNPNNLIVIIVVPICAFLLIIVVAFLVAYCWLKMRARELELTKVEPKSKSGEVAGEPNEEFNPIQVNEWPFTRSMFVNKRDVSYFGKIEEDAPDNEKVGDTDSIYESSQAGNRSIYRTNYPFDPKNNNTESDFFKSLEEKASSKQQATIIRPVKPQSIFSDSSFSLPTAYYEQTTPYFSNNNNNKSSQFPRTSKASNEKEVDEDDVVRNNNLSDEEVDFDDGEEAFGAIDDQIDMNDFVEAYNPHVRIPRPKLQLNPLKIFRLGPKQEESNQ